MKVETNKLELEEYRYSIGSTPMVDSILKIFDLPKNTMDTVALNISTLLRNTYEQDTPISLWVSHTHKEIHDIVSELKQVMEASVDNPKILLYYIDYAGLIPEYLKRPLNKSRETMFRGMSKLIPMLKKDGISLPGESNDTINMKFGPLRANPADLARMVKRFHNKKNTLLVSHLALDYHLYRYIRKMRLVYSYTGAVVDQTEFGVKLFGNPNIPFNRHTHALLGDKVSFKSGLTIKLKRELADIAVKDRWNLKPESSILTSMQNHQFSPPFVICR